MNQISITVGVVTYNSESTIQASLESIEDQDFEREKYEIIVIDGGSSDETLNIAKDYCDRIFQKQNASIGACRQIAFSNAKGRYIAFTDSDCVVPSSWLSDLYTRIQSQNDESVIGVGGPNIAFPGDPPFTQVVDHMQRSFIASGGSPQSYEFTEVEFAESIPACNILYDKEQIQPMNFDEEINVGEDAEFHNRLSKMGYRFIFDPNITVFHHLPSTFSEFIGKNISYGSSMAKIQLQRREIIRWYSFGPPFMIILVLYYVLQKRNECTSLNPHLLFIWLIITLPLVVKTYLRTNLTQSLYIPLLLPLQYFSYGIGFLKGLFQYMLK